jgi:hypothetical protein
MAGLGEFGQIKTSVTSHNVPPIHHSANSAMNCTAIMSAKVKMHQPHIIPLQSYIGYLLYSYADALPHFGLKYSSVTVHFNVGKSKNASATYHSIAVQQQVYRLLVILLHRCGAASRPQILLCDSTFGHNCNRYTSLPYTNSSDALQSVGQNRNASALHCTTVA